MRVAIRTPFGFPNAKTANMELMGGRADIRLDRPELHVQRSLLAGDRDLANGAQLTVTGTTPHPIRSPGRHSLAQHCLARHPAQLSLVDHPVFPPLHPIQLLNDKSRRLDWSAAGTWLAWDGKTGATDVR
jgi:hypothetical protein